MPNFGIKTIAKRKEFFIILMILLRFFLFFEHKKLAHIPLKTHDATGNMWTHANIN